MSYGVAMTNPYLTALKVITTMIALIVAGLLITAFVQLGDYKLEELAHINFGVAGVWIGWFVLSLLATLVANAIVWKPATLVEAVPVPDEY